MGNTDDARKLHWQRRRTPCRHYDSMMREFDELTRQHGHGMASSKISCLLRSLSIPTHGMVHGLLTRLCNACLLYTF